MAVRALKKGAVDFIEKPFEASLILETLNKASERSKNQNQEEEFAAQSKALLAKLTVREAEIAEKLVEGKPNKIIAFELGISIRTVETHRARVLSKMDVRSLADLVRIYLSAKT